MAQSQYSHQRVSLRRLSFNSCTQRLDYPQSTCELRTFYFFSFFTIDLIILIFKYSIFLFSLLFLPPPLTFKACCSTASTPPSATPAACRWRCSGRRTSTTCRPRARRSSCYCAKRPRSISPQCASACWTEGQTPTQPIRLKTEGLWELYFKGW